MTNDKFTGIEFDDGHAFLRPLLMAIGLIATGLALWLLNDLQEQEISRAPMTITSQTG